MKMTSTPVQFCNRESISPTNLTLVVLLEGRAGNGAGGERAPTGTSIGQIAAYNVAGRKSTAVLKFKDVSYRLHFNSTNMEG